MIRTILIDDEQHCRDSLSATLKNHFPEIELLAVCTNVIEGQEAIEKLKPELVFLDVEIPPSTGFDLLQNLSSISFEVIFTTAFDKYAVRAIKASALDFILKPVGKEDLSLALERFKQKKSKNDSQQQMETLFENIRHLKDPLKKIMLPSQNGFEYVNVKDIIRLQADSNYTTFYFTDKRKIVVSKTLKEYEDMLSGKDFFRVHQSHIINTQFIKNYVKGEGGIVVMQDGSEIDVSRRRKEDFLKALESL
ncbi:MAG: LytTR family DNA-binding domain-containing protein [Bacteroidota bacterium]